MTFLFFIALWVTSSAVVELLADLPDEYTEG